MRDCYQVLPTLRFRVNPAHRGIGARRPRGRAAITSPAALRARQRNKNRSGPPALQPRSARKSRLVGRDDRVVFAFGAAKTQPITSLSARNPRWALAGGVVPLFSTPGLAQSDYDSDARLTYRGYFRPAVP